MQRFFEKMKWIILVAFSGMVSMACAQQDQDREVQEVHEEIPITASYFFGNWINMYLIEATTRKDTLTEMTTYQFMENGYYDCSKNVSDRWAVNASTKSFFLYYNNGQTYAEFEIEIVSREEFILRREYVGNMFIYNFKRTN